jgi:FkbM family methyltransferase
MENLAMASIRKYVLTFEDSAPALFNWARYILHVVIKKDTVYPAVTKEIFKLINSKDAIAIDVGANVGIVTRYFSQYFAVTHAIEPLPYLSARLKKLENNRIKVHQCAVGAEEGDITIRTPVGAGGQPFHALSTASQSNILSMFEHEGEVSCTVQQRRLSSLIPATAGRVGYLKIDVEGFELAVLLGADELITRERPIMQVEIDKTHNPDYLKTLKLLEEKKYAGFSFNEKGIKNNMLDCVNAQVVNKNLSLNTTIFQQSEFLFIPQEKLEMFTHLILES